MADNEIILKAKLKQEQTLKANMIQRGLQGEQGEAATIEVGTVSTGAAGTDAIVTNVGTENAAVLDFVIPRGDKGDTGAEGQSANISSVTASVDNNTGTPSVSVSLGGTPLNRTIDFDFKNLKGAKGDKGDKGDTGADGKTVEITDINASVNNLTGTPAVTVTRIGTPQNFSLDFDFYNLKGEKGETGDTGTAATVTVGTTTTGEAGTQASVTNSGTSSAAVLNFTIPKGDKGDTGNTGATGNGVSGTSLLSWEGLVKTYRMSYTNGSYYDYTVENGTGQVDWGGISGVISQQTDLQDVLHSSKGYLDNGTLLTDTTLYNYVYGYSHSTFDLSKFTKVGSPIITDDGIASGLNKTNYLYCVLTNFDRTKSWEILSPIFSVTNTNSGQHYILQTADFASIRMYVDGAKIGVKYRLDGGTAQDINKNNVLSVGTKYQIKMAFTGTEYQFKYRDISSNSEWLNIGAGTVTSSTVLHNNITTINIGYHNSNPYGFENGSLDLKYFSITNDSTIKFSGNKTGIDTIKPADYTVVGSPTISADGIASGFSGSNAIETTYLNNLNSANNWQIEFFVDTPATFKPNNGVLGTSQIVDYRFQCSPILRLNENGNFQLLMSSNATSWDIANNVLTTDVFSTSTRVGIRLKFSGTHYLLYTKLPNAEWKKQIEINNSNKIYSSNTTLLFGNAFKNDASQYYTGSIDLNSIKIYTNGDLIYQPCLLIPYTESSTGSKIVDVAYRDRVIDVYNQFGSANYYTIDETNKNVTLPMGELYGLIGQRTLRASYRNGINYWEEYSDRTLEQGGSCTSGTTVNLLKPFADTNYVLTVPYSAKTTTSFTPSASGDWIAKGLGE